MIIVLGFVLIQPDQRDAALTLSREHVERSKAEAGCIAHDVFLDPSNPLRLSFIEKWSDMSALQTHFQVPETRAFGKALTAMSATPPTIEIYDAKVLN